MEVKEAVKIALQYVADLFCEENLRNLGLEEVIYDESDGDWDVTVGFSRPWDYPPANVFRALQTGESPPRREYRVVRIKASTGAVESVKIRTEE